MARQIPMDPGFEALKEWKDAHKKLILEELGIDGEEYESVADFCARKRLELIRCGDRSVESKELGRLESMFGAEIPDVTVKKVGGSNEDLEELVAVAVRRIKSD